MLDINITTNWTVLHEQSKQFVHETCTSFTFAQDIVLDNQSSYTFHFPNIKCTFWWITVLHSTMSPVYRHIGISELSQSADIDTWYLTITVVPVTTSYITFYIWYDYVSISLYLADEICTEHKNTRSFSVRVILRPLNSDRLNVLTTLKIVFSCTLNHSIHEFSCRINQNCLIYDISPF